jgi:hypothetical protein
VVVFSVLANLKSMQNVTNNGWSVNQGGFQVDKDSDFIELGMMY